MEMKSRNKPTISQASRNNERTAYPSVLICFSVYHRKLGDNSLSTASNGACNVTASRTAASRISCAIRRSPAQRRLSRADRQRDNSRRPKCWCARDKAEAFLAGTSSMLRHVECTVYGYSTNSPKAVVFTHGLEIVFDSFRPTNVTMPETYKKIRQ